MGGVTSKLFAGLNGSAPLKRFLCVAGIGVCIIGGALLKQLCDDTETTSASEIKRTNPDTKAADKKLNAHFEEAVMCTLKVPLLHRLPADQLPFLAAVCEKCECESQQVICSQGDIAGSFIIVVSGEAKVTSPGLSDEVMLRSGDCFGRSAFVVNGRYAETLTALAPVVILRISRDDIQQLHLGERLKLGSSEATSDRSSAYETFWEEAADARQVFASSQEQQVLRKDLTKVGLLGCGCFGAVWLYEHEASSRAFAMKGISKGYVVKTGMQRATMVEKTALMVTNSSFLVELYETYNGAQSFYFLMEACLGGEVFSTYKRKGFSGSEPHAKFYIGCLVLALDHLHQRHIISRGVRPEECVLDSEGRMKFCDLGLCKFTIHKTYTTCGTPDYFAPEVIASIGHHAPYDWWAAGVMLYELMAGSPPFESAYPMQIYSKVMKGIGKIEFSPKCKGNVGTLIKALMEKEPNKRLPMLPGGIENIQRHKWYSGFRWEKLADGTLDPPYAPTVNSTKDFSNFTAKEEDQPRMVEYKDDGSGWDAEFAPLRSMYNN